MAQELQTRADRDHRDIAHIDILIVLIVAIRADHVLIIRSFEVAPVMVLVEHAATEEADADVN